MPMYTPVLSALADGSFKIETDDELELNNKVHDLLLEEGDSEAEYANQEGCGRSRSDSTTSSRLSFCWKRI